MISLAIINLGIVGLTCVLLIIYLIRFVFRYKHHYESNPLCTSVVVFSLLVVIITTFILPVDIFLLSYVKQADGNFKTWATNETLALIDTTILGTYYSLYGIVCLLLFITLPFLYVFNEESESNSRDRLFTAIKFTSATLFLTIFLLAIAELAKGKTDPLEIFNKIIQYSKLSSAQQALDLALALISTIGFVNVSFYTASGIFSWPISLIQGTSSLSDRVSSMSDRETVLKMQINQLTEKSRVVQLSLQEAEELADAQNDLRALERESAALSSYRQTLTYKLRNVTRLIQIIVGALLCLLSIFLVVTLILVNSDKLVHGAGPKQGYVLLKPQIFNPLETVFMKLQDLLFIGPLPLLIIICFFTVATISGIRNLGLWLLMARIYRIKVGRTQPQALLFFCGTIMLSALSFILILYSMTTQYITYGDQNFKTIVNGTTILRPCNLEIDTSECKVSRGSTIIMRMMSEMWIFGAIFYWWSWAFVVVASVSFLAYIIRGKRSAAHDIVYDEDDEFLD